MKPTEEPTDFDHLATGAADLDPMVVLQRQPELMVDLLREVTTQAGEHLRTDPDAGPSVGGAARGLTRAGTGFAGISGNSPNGMMRFGANIETAVTAAGAGRLPNLQRVVGSVAQRAHMMAQHTGPSQKNDEDNLTPEALLAKERERREENDATTDYALMFSGVNQGSSIEDRLGNYLEHRAKAINTVFFNNVFGGPAAAFTGPGLLERTMGRVRLGERMGGLMNWITGRDGDAPAASMETPSLEMESPTPPTPSQGMTP